MCQHERGAYDLDAAVDVVVTVVEVQRVLRVVLDAAYALRLSLGIVEVRRLEVLLVLVLVVGEVSSGLEGDQGPSHALLKERALAF